MMKWWGWGDEKLSFPMEDKPLLWPWIREKLGMEVEARVFPTKRENIRLKPPILNGSFTAELKTFLKPDQLTSDEEERLLHSYGKSYPDLFRVRQGIVQRPPDAVVLPSSHEEVEKIVMAADRFGVVVIPFGGGTNIVGGVEPRDESSRMVVSVDMRRMNRLLSVDPFSRTAVLQTGALGPKLEADLQAQGFSLGHFPDSFEYSTLGGWLATRSAGMQSDAYGKIEDMVVALKLVTAKGTIVTRPTPASSAGPDLNRMIVGSEGVLGIITEATMRVHKTPAVKDYRGFLFPTFEEGVNAIHETHESGYVPSLIRLQDPGETELAFKMKSPKKGLQALVQKGVKSYLKYKGYHSPCIMIIGFEGEDEPVRHTRAHTLAILRRHRAFPLGQGVGSSWSKDKFNVPYLRDYIMDYGCMADVAETAAVWSKVVPVYDATVKAVKEKFNHEGMGFGYIGCHISHTYRTGACLYFTYSARQTPGRELEQYYSYKKVITDSFMANGATLTHHHAIGYEHMDWMEEEVSATGLEALRGLKRTLDPNAIFNPGKLLPPAVTSVRKEATRPIEPSLPELEPPAVS